MTKKRAARKAGVERGRRRASHKSSMAHLIRRAISRENAEREREMLESLRPPPIIINGERIA